MKEWFTLPELAGAKLPGMPLTVDGYAKFAARSGWRAHADKVRKQVGREGGGGFEYHYSLLAPVARQKLAFLNAEIPPEPTDRAKLLWRKYEALTDDQKAICKKRLELLADVEELKISGISASDAVKHCTRKADIARATYYEWQKMVEGQARQDWLAALAPSTSSFANGLVSELTDCHPEAWDVLASDFLRAEGPAFSACYRRAVEVAEKKGWAPVPCERTLRRRMDTRHRRHAFSFG